ncbi:MAG: hypothetical protein RRB13_11980 [bacterium]|nr:hypothetical protein [bacterium]
MKLVKVILILLLAAALMGCKEDDDERPADHTVNKNGSYHAPNLNEPRTYCVSCHGSDLRGGGEAPSCYSCHGQKWP